jgi:hypothetical protein
MNQQLLRLYKTSFGDTKFVTKFGPSGQVAARARRIGYCISLCGVNDRVDCGRGHTCLVCPHCGLTYDEIRKIAEWITLKEQPDCRFQIGPFDRAFHIAPRQRWSRNEIIVNIKILHRNNVDGPVSDSLDRCLSNLRAELKRLCLHERRVAGSNGWAFSALIRRDLGIVHRPDEREGLREGEDT